ncbi:MAG: PAS domain S-box protein [Elusimicrobia bacterium]|nr:PAS domain S-box protein [Elusimicrobiota bacterium]
MKRISSLNVVFERWASPYSARTLSRKMLTGVLPAVIVITLLMGLFSFLIVRRQILKGVQKEMDTLAQNVSLGLQTFFRQRVNDLESLSETPLITDYLKNLGYGLLPEAEIYRNEIEKYFVNFSARSRVYYDIAYIRPDGKRVCSVQRKNPSEIIASLTFLDFLKQRKYYEGPLEKMEADGPLIKRYGKSIVDEHKAFLGAVVLDLDMSHVEEILKQLRVGEKGSAYLEDEKGNLILGIRPEFQEPLVGLSVIRGTSWRVGVIAQAEDFLYPLKQIQYLTIFFSVFACVLIMVLIIGRVSALVRPIRSMAEGTHRFASGDLTYRFPEPKTKELQILASSFNQMAANLEERTKELEQRLRQLTSLRDMEEAVIQRLDEETILRVCIESVARGFSFDRTGLYWVDYGKREIVGRFLHGTERMGFTEGAFRKRSVPLGESDILNEVVRSRNAVLVQLPNSDPRLNREFVMESQTREFVMAPICGKDRVLGILSADNYFSGRSLDQSDKEGLMLFANAVGLALENTMLFQTLAESEARYRTVLENSPEAVIGISREHWITTWNRGAERIFGYAGAEIIGKPLAVLFAPDAGSEFKKLLNGVMEEGSVRNSAMPGLAKGGRLLDLSVSWGGAHQDFWMNKEWTVVIHDVTEAKKLQQQLIRSEKLSAVGQLISGIAHELNNPLQAVVGYADLLCDQMKSFKASVSAKTWTSNEADGMVENLDDLQIVTENAMRCQKIIENLLLFVRQGEVEKTNVDLEKVVQASLQLLHYKLKKAAQVEVEMGWPASLPSVKGNFQQLQQVVVNLINNACDAMSAVSGTKRLRIDASETGGVCRLEIHDSGPGIPEGICGRVFEPFFTTKGEGRGTGLGLAVCRQIIEEHGGRIGFRSQPGAGTAFWFDLPASVKEEVSQRPEPAPPPVRNRSILLVDDEPDVLSFLLKVLHAEGDWTDTASSLMEAALKASEKAYDLVVTDIRLGEGTGINLYDNWTLWSPHTRPAFLFVTGDVIDPLLAQEIEKRDLPILHKPVDIASFQRAVRTLLCKSQ